MAVAVAEAVSGHLGGAPVGRLRLSPGLIEGELLNPIGLTDQPFEAYADQADARPLQPEGVEEFAGNGVDLLADVGGFGQGA